MTKIIEVRIRNCNECIHWNKVWGSCHNEKSYRTYDCYPSTHGLAIPDWCPLPDKVEVNS